MSIGKFPDSLSQQILVQILVGIILGRLGVQGTHFFGAVSDHCVFLLGGSLILLSAVSDHWHQHVMSNSSTEARNTIKKRT